MLRIRPYKTKDAEKIRGWIKDAKEHALWCGNLIDYPLTQERLNTMHTQYNSGGEGGMFTALNREGIPVGFFAIMHTDYKINNSHLGFIIVDPELRNRGYGRQMVQMAVRYCFCMLFTSSVTLKVYDINEAAHRCYRAAGFADVTHNDQALVFEGENWGAHDMIIIKKKFKLKGEC